MAYRVTITTEGFKCFRCGHQWVPRDIDAPPRVCPSPKCKSPYWHKPRRNNKSEENKEEAV